VGEPSIEKQRDYHESFLEPGLVYQTVRLTFFADTTPLREYWSHFKAKNRVFQRRLNEILETART
jgi:hypothetical protein